MSIPVAGSPVGPGAGMARSRLQRPPIQLLLLLPAILYLAVMTQAPFILTVGRIEARKNQIAALAAVEKLEGVTLVLAGPERDPALAAKLRESPQCRVLGRVDQPTLELL